MNYTGQKLGTKTFYKDYIYTHAILVLSQGLYIESTGGKGVVVFSANDLINRFKNEYNEDFKVIRNIKVNNRDIQKKIFVKAEYYYEQKYNSAFILPWKRKARSYCSELIANIYKDVEIPFRKPLYATWPIHLLREFDKNDDWKDVTEDYIINLNNLKKIQSDEQSNYLLDNATLLVTLFISQHKHNDAMRLIKQCTNNYQVTTSSFYDIMYNSQISENYKELEKYEYEPINFDQILNSQKTMLGRLKTIEPIIQNYIEEKNGSHNITDEDIQTSWKEENNQKIIKEKIDSKIDTLLYIVKENYKINLQYNSNIIFYTVYYKNDELSIPIKEKVDIKNYLSKFKEEYSIAEDIELTLKEIIKLIENNDSFLNEARDEVFFNIINLHTMSLFIVHDIYLKYRQLQEDLDKV